MKLTWRQIEPFVKKPDPAARVILVYGPDDGLMRERSKTMALAIVADINDPFNVAALTGDIITADPARLTDEAHAISMMGGNRLIRVENAGDKLTPVLKDYLKNPSPHTLVILEAGELSTRSPLRTLCEKSANAVALPCYVEDERDLVKLIREQVQGANKRIDNDAVTWLAAAISGDRAKARGEIEKLITYKGEDATPISLADAQAICGNAGAKGLDELVYGTASGRAQAALAAHNLLSEEGVSFVVTLRALQNHFRKLHLTRLRIDGGDEAGIAMKKLQPPVFFKLEDDFRAQLRNWPLTAIEKVLARLMDVEAQCKRTGAPVDTLTAQAVLGIAMMKK
ncbi:MAG: DNA polymerase III subunit delta [Alphaproteobacteria bacterium]